MPRFIISRVMVMLISSAFCAQPLLFAGGAPDQQAYVVTVRPDASSDGIGVIAKQMAASYGGTLVEAAGEGEDSFVIRVPQSRARMLAVDPHVKSIVPMRFTPAPQTVVETVPWSSGVSYSYDGTGNISQIGNDVFAYDGVSRLAQASVNGVARKYDYDAYGNRTACTQFGPNDCQAFTINTAENKNRIAGAEYDKNDPAGAGNVTGLSGHVYSYDPLNMMTRDTYGTLAHEFVYTADDERIATYTVFGSSWSWTVRGTDEKVLREFTSSDGPAGPGTSAWQWTKDYVWRDGLLLASRQPDGTNTATYHYHLDHLGTPRRVTDQNDRIVGVHDYYAFGIEPSGGTAEPSATKLKYTGHERDSWSSGSSEDLDYMHARYYSPWLGRFLSVDPALDLKRTVTSPQRWNRYAYVANNPLRYTDPNGLLDYDALLLGHKLHVHIDDRLSMDKQKALQSQVNAGLATLNENKSKLTASQTRTILNIKTVSVMEMSAGQRSGVDTAIGKLTFKSNYVEDSSPSWLGSAVAHDALHVAIANFMTRSGLPGTDPISEEKSAMQFQLGVGRKTGLSGDEIHYLQDLIKNPEQLRSYVLQPGPGN